MTSLALSALSFVVAAQADSILILRSSDEAWRPFEQRLVAELQASGFTVATAQSGIDPTGDIPAQLWAESQKAGALAALWFQPRADGRVDAWVADQVTGKAVLRTYEQPNSGAELARLALRAVELLHASLLEVRLMPPRQQDEFPSEVKRFAASERVKPHVIFGTGVGVAFTGRLRPQPLLELQLGYAFTPLVAVEVQAVSSVFPTRVEDPKSRYGADVGVAILRAQAAVTPLRRGDFALGVTGGTGALLLWASGDSDLMGIESKSEARVTWLACAGLIAALKVSDGIRVQLLGSLGVALPQVGVALAGNLQETIGRPVIDVLLRLEFE